MDTIPVSLGARSYEVLLGPGLLADLPELLASRMPAAHYAVVSDSHVAELYGKAAVAGLRAAGHAASLSTFPAGEWNKTRETWAAVTDQLLAAGVGRDGAIVSLGGGVTGDVAGFVAATYLRGIAYAQVPTTLLAMVDSSIGGKTGVDTAHGKNLIGAFHQPAVVVADVETVQTLSWQHLAAGMAEALKHGVIADAEYFGRLEAWAPAVRAKEPGVLVEVVRRSVEIKAEVVAADEREAGRRAVLNYGHTVGHAIEATSGYELLHGEAIAVGMVIEAVLAERLEVGRGVSERVRGALTRYDLPVERPEQSAETLLEVMRHDKKVRAEALRFALPSVIGRMARGPGGEWTFIVPQSTLLDVLS